MSLFGDKWNKSKHIDKLQQEQPYEAPINVRQIANLTYGEAGLHADYYEPMALTRADTNPDKSAMHVAIVLHDDPFGGSRYDVMPLSMELARRGMAAYAPELTPDPKDGTPFFWQQVRDVLSLLADLAVDRHRLGLHCENYGRVGNKVILVGCGTGATLAAAVLRLFYNARMREYFAAQCPYVADYFGMGSTPTVDMSALVRIGGFVSMSGKLRPQEEPNVRLLERYFGVGYDKTMLATYLDVARYYSADYPPMLLVTTAADPVRGQALGVQSAFAMEAKLRILECPREDAEGHVLEPLFWARYPLWEKSKEVNSQIVAYCKSL